MPAFFTGYPINPASAVAGMIGDLEFTTVLSAEVTTGPVAFGLVVGRGAAANQVRLGGTGYVGISVLDKANLNAAGTGYSVGDIAGAMVKGMIWVTASTAVTPADPVTFTAATGVIGAGLVGGTIVGARFLASAGIGALVPVLLA